jgi:glycerol uptake facilitator protein
MADERPPPARSREAPASTIGAAPLARRLGAEFVGALLLVAIGSGAATLFAVQPAQRVEAVIGQLTEQGGGGEEEARRFYEPLFRSTFGDALTVALAFGLILAVLVYAFGGVSGGHFNPAVTLGVAITRRFPWKEVPFYVIVQCVGGIAGAFVIAGIYGQDGAAIADTDILFGASVVADGVNEWQALLAEAVIGFVLMTAIMAVAVDPRAPKGWSGLIIGLALAAGALLTGAATGGSANFARSLGPFVASLLYDVGGIPWGDLIVYAVGPLVGAAAAALLYEAITGLERIAPAPRPGAATPAEEPVLVIEADDRRPPPPPAAGPG